MKLRLRSRRPDSATGGNASEPAPAIRKRIVKRSAPPRGLNKRRRALDDDMGREDALDSDVENAPELGAPHLDEPEETVARPHTPKRARIAPEALPLGLERSDFHSLHHSDPHQHGDNSAGDGVGTGVVVEADGEAWSTEEDRILVELVLEKLKLTKSDWQDCARSLGKDRGSVGRRWKSLMIGGDVGLKPRPGRGRAKIHGTWR